jgi:PAS domain S-box-containing protein
LFTGAVVWEARRGDDPVRNVTMRDADAAGTGPTGLASSSVHRAPRGAGGWCAEGTDLTRLILESTSDGLVVVAPNGTLIAFNERFTRMCRVPDDALVSRRAERVLSSIAPQLHEPQSLAAEVARIDAGPDEQSCTLRFVDGRVLIMVSRPSAEAGDEDAGRVWSFHDVTDRARVEGVLQETSRQYEHLTRQVHAAIYELDLQTWRFIAVNDVMCQLTGYRQDELLRMNPAELLVEDEREKFERRRERISSGQAREDIIEYRWRHKDGRESWAVSSLKLLPGPEGSGRVVGVALDIGARKRAEEERLRLRDELMRAQKHESLSVMAAGVAHDFNNLLQVILGNADLLACDLEEGAGEAAAIEQIRKAARRASELSQQMLTYAGQIDSDQHHVDLADVVHASRDLLRGTAGERVVLRLEIEPAPSLLADAVQLERIVLSLALNAVEAIPAGERGTVVVRVREADGSLPTSLPCFPDAGPPLGRCAALEVEDDGCGMDAETVRRAFDPFFTTKFTGRGLGLASVLGIVRGHGGRITVDSRPDQGTLFRVLIPATAP